MLPDSVTLSQILEPPVRTVSILLCCGMASVCGCFQATMAVPYCLLQKASTTANRWANPDTPRLSFPTEDKNEMLTELMKQLQLGMPIDKARSILMANGFWHVEDLQFNYVTKEIYRRPRSSGALVAHVFSSQVIVVTLYPHGEQLQGVSLNYFDRDPDELPESATQPVSTPVDIDKVPSGLRSDDPLLAGFNLPQGR